MPTSLFAADDTMLRCSAKSKLMDIFEKMCRDVILHEADTSKMVKQN